MRGCMEQVAAADLSLPGGRMLLNLLSMWGGKRTTNLCQRNGWEKSGRKKLQAKVNKMSGLLARLSKADGWYCSLWQLQLKMQETTGVADKYLKITTSCLAQTISPLLGKQSFVLELFYLLFITGWQRWYLNIISKIKVLNARNVLSCSKILKPDGLTAPCLHTKAGGKLCLPPPSGSAACWSPHGYLGRLGWQGGCGSWTGFGGRQKCSSMTSNALSHWDLLPAPLLALGACQVQLTLQFCSLETPWPPPFTFAASSPSCCLAWQTQPGPLAGSLPLVGVQLAEGAGLLWGGKYGSTPALTRHFSVLINLASASGTSPPLGTLYFYSWLEIQA